MAATIEQTQKFRTRLSNPNLTREEYEQIRFEFFKLNEGLKNSAYLDFSGIKTVGIGFNMMRPDSQNEWNAAFARYNILIPFRDVFTSKRSLSDYEVKILFNYSVDLREQYLRSMYGKEIWDNKLKPNERLAIEDLYYNGGNKLVGKNTNFYKNIILYTETENKNYLDMAINEVEHRSNPHNHHGIQNRRIAEAEMLKYTITNNEVTNNEVELLGEFAANNINSPYTEAINLAETVKDDWITEWEYNH